jgi:hypothetical protein
MESGLSKKSEISIKRRQRTRSIVRKFFSLTLLDQVLELTYWVAVVVGLVLLGRTLADRPFVLAVAGAAVCVSAVLIYFRVVRALRQFLTAGEPGRPK